MTLNGHVYDSFTKAALKAKITLMRRDSSVVDTTTADAWRTTSYFRFTVPSEEEYYIIKASREGYEDSYVNFELKHIARNQYFDLPDNLMKKKSDDDIYKDVALDGITVTGTKVKVAYRGDTVVYNASAFNLPDGSMLDGLIRQLPGAQLKSNGDIYINGKRIDYLTLNGKDFFKGNNRVMLENLPYYTVNDLKVYHKSSEQSRWQGREVEKKDYVMDVTLKLKYSRGYLASIEGGAGTSKRYSGRLFGLYYTDHTRLSVFTNVNNINDKSATPTGDGSWSSYPSLMGEQTSESTGLNLNTEDKNKHVEEQLDMTVSWADASNENRSAGETFASAGNLFRRSITNDIQSDFRFDVSNNFIVKKTFKLYSYIGANYSNSKNTSYNRAATYNSDPVAIGDIVHVMDSTFSKAYNSIKDLIVNRSISNRFTRNRTLTMFGYVSFFQKLPWGDNIQLGLNYNYTKRSPSESFSKNKIEYVQSDSTDVRNIYADTHGRNFSYKASAAYNISLFSNWNFSVNAEYGLRETSSNNLNYRLDRLGGEWTVKDNSPAINFLPSTRDSLLLALDAQNTNRFTDDIRTFSGKLNVYKGNDKMFFSLILPFDNISERLKYNNNVVDTIARRNVFIFSPQMRFYIYGEKATWSVSYNMSHSQPDLSGMMPDENDINPLARRINNPNLKNTLTHSLSVGCDFRVPEVQQSVGFNLDFNSTSNSTGMRTNYDTKTGAYTYQQDNVNGNWNMTFSTSFSRPLDKPKRLMLSSNLSFAYRHDVDFDISYDGESQVLSRVKNINLNESLSLNYSFGDFTFGVTGWYSWRNSTSGRANFSTINSIDYNYGINADCKLPLDIRAEADMKMYSRRGYQDVTMNTDDLVWNASLSRCFVNGRLILSLKAYDILHQLSSTYYSINAQGRTESWNNTFSRYAMLSVAYKFSADPKK